MEPILHEVYSVTATAEPDVFLFDVELTDMSGERYRAPYGSRPNDTFGINPIIREWLIAHEGEYTILPYVAPTADEIRAAMPSLSRVAFRTAFKNNGMTTAKINAAIAAVEDESLQEDFQIIWEDAQTFGRLDPFVLMVAEFAGKTPEQIDTIWTAALMN